MPLTNEELKNDEKQFGGAPLLCGYMVPITASYTVPGGKDLMELGPLAGKSNSSSPKIIKKIWNLKLVLKLGSPGRLRANSGSLMQSNGVGYPWGFFKGDWAPKRVEDRNRFARNRS